jgi:hypothetical protein
VLCCVGYELEKFIRQICEYRKEKRSRGLKMKKERAGGRNIYVLGRYCANIYSIVPDQWLAHTNIQKKG